MKKLTEFLDYAISKVESKSIKGGMMCQCHCTAIAGAWTGSYENYDQVYNSIAYWCGEGGGSFDCQVQ